MQVIGHLGKDATTNTPNGKTVINFSVAHTEKFTNNGQQQDKTIWVEAQWWTDKTAIVQYLKKGTQVYIEGSAEIRTYQTQDGRSGASLVCKVLSVQLLGSNQGISSSTTHDAGTGYAKQNTQATQQQQDDSDGLPF